MADPIIPPRPAAQAAPTASKSEAAAARLQPLEGKTELDEKLSFECEALAWAAIERIAASVATELFTCVAPDGDVTLILVDDACSRAFHLQQSTALQVASLEQAFERVRDRAGGARHPAVAPQAEEPAGPTMAGVPAVGPITAAASAALDLLGLFRADTSYTGRAVTIPRRALLLELGRHLRAKAERRPRLLYPRLQPVPPATGQQLRQARLIALFQPLETARAEAEAAILGLSRAVASREEAISRALDGRRKPREQGDGQPPPEAVPSPSGRDDETEEQILTLVEERNRLEAARRLHEATEVQRTAMLTALSARDEESGSTGLALVQQALEISARFEEGDGRTFLVFAEAVAAGGSYRVRRNLWRTLFVGDGLEFSGGAAVAYAVIDGNAELVLCGTRRAYEPHRGFAWSWWGRRSDGLDSLSSPTCSASAKALPGQGLRKRP